jgi:MoaA/NifB/PqqE/SkfB family radical SAM enzyme
MYRAGGQLSKVLDTLRRLRRAKDRQNSLYPLLEFRSLAIRDNQRQLPDLLRLATEHRADLFSVKSLRPYDYRGTSVDARLVPADPILSRYSYQDSRADADRRLDFVRSGPLQCAKPHFSPTLNSNGILSFCSYASQPQEHFGDVTAEGFLNVWRSPFARSIRARFQREQGSETCATCYFRSAHKRTILHHVLLGTLPPDITVLRPETPAEFLAAVAEPALSTARPRDCE